MNARVAFDPADDEVARLRTPPHSLEAEQSVLGGLLIDNGAWDRVGDVLQEGDFYRAEHKAIFAVIGREILAARQADIITVFERLQTLGKADEAGGLPYLNSLAQSVLSAANIRRYAEIVRERSVLRRLIATSDEIATAAFNPQDRTVAQIVADAEDKVVAISAEGARGRTGPQPAAGLFVKRIDQLNDIAQNGIAPGAPTGLADLDAALNGGMQDGRVYVLAARPSVGKSSLAMQIALHRAKAGDGVLLLSQEMPAEECMDRALCNLGAIDYGRLQRAELGNEDWSALTEAGELVSKLPLWIDDQPALTLRDIRAKAFSLRREGLRLIVVDYLQLCAGTPAKGGTRNGEIEEITRGIKALAKQLRLPVILLSQLSREVEKRATPEPNLGDLRDSGAIEQDADVVLFLWPVRTLGTSKIVGCGIAKNRQGDRGQRIALEFRGHFQRWLTSTADISPQRERATHSKGLE